MLKHCSSTGHCTGPLASNQPNIPTESNQLAVRYMWSRWTPYNQLLSQVRLVSGCRKVCAGLWELETSRPWKGQWSQDALSLFFSTVLFSVILNRVISIQYLFRFGSSFLECSQIFTFYINVDTLGWFSHILTNPIIL